MGAISILWTVFLVAFDGNGPVLGDSVTALGFSICFYYGFTGLACGWYYRRELFKSVRGFILAGVLPVVGGGTMAFIFVKAYLVVNTPGYNYSAKPFLGFQVPIVIGIGTLLLGVPFMLLCAFKFRAFFSRKTEVAPEGIL